MVNPKYILKLYLENYEKLEEISPEEPYVHYLKGEAYYKLKQYDKSLEEFDKLTGLSPADPMAYFTKANIYIRLHQYENAIKNYLYTIFAFILKIIIPKFR